MDYVTILGCGSALPIGNRFPSAQVLKHKAGYFLIDCGEGTQSRLREQQIPYSKISHIFISHLHGDHFFGLPGLLSSFHLLGRKNPLKLFGPPGLMEILNLQFKYSATFLNYEIEFFPIEKKEKHLIFESKSIEVFAFPLNHRIACHGYIFKEKKKPSNLIVKRIEAYNIPNYKRANIKLGADFICEDGTVVPNSELTTPAAAPKNYAYCSDNRIKQSVKKYLEGVDVLYHETTFMENETDRAKKTFHSTTIEAAKLAKELSVETLIMGHYSARYKDLNPLLLECKSIFENVILGKEGLRYDFN